MRPITRVLSVALVGAAALAGAPAFSALPPLRLIPYASGFTAPVAFIQDPTDPQVQFVVEQVGRIRTLVSGDLQALPFLDITNLVLSGGERGLLGLAFPPDASTSGRIYVNYTNQNGDTVIARFKRSASPRIADPNTWKPMVWSADPVDGVEKSYIPQPYSNHNGGCVAFGSDGYLYIGMGDGGSGNDPENRAQDPASLLGKMLRIDVNVAEGDPKGFRVPADNPFVSRSGYRPEIWDFGVRNPWRFSFDDAGAGATGALIVADVGQSRREEVDYEPRGSGGRNFGWRIKEGSIDTPDVPPTSPAFLPLTPPNYDYDHTVGRSITGGYVYRGTEMPDIVGRYFFGDFVNSRVFSAAVTVDPATHEATFSDVIDHTDTLQSNIGSVNISAFGRDSTGELFVLDYGRGAVLRLTQAHKPKPPANVRIIR